MRIEWLILVLLVMTSSASSDEIARQVVGCGGTEASSTNFTLNGTVGQPIIGLINSPGYGISQGFWIPMTGGAGGCCLNRGDFDHNGRVDVSDLVSWAKWAFSGSTTGPGCEDPPGFYPECDFDASGQVDVIDIVSWVKWSYSGDAGPTPCP